MFDFAFRPVVGRPQVAHRHELEPARHICGGIWILTCFQQEGPPSVAPVGWVPPSARSIQNSLEFAETTVHAGNAREPCDECCLRSGKLVSESLKKPDEFGSPKRFARLYLPQMHPAIFPALHHIVPGTVVPAALHRDARRYMPTRCSAERFSKAPGPHGPAEGVAGCHGCVRIRWHPVLVEVEAKSLSRAA